MTRVRLAHPAEIAFLSEMARLACTMEDHPLPAADDPEVLALVPGQIDGAVIATDAAEEPIGAAWWHFHEPPIVRDAHDQAVPELVMAVVEVARGRGVGTALIEELVHEATRRSFAALALNVHLRNPATRLYMRMGFRVAGAGRGWFGVAMMRTLVEGLPAE